MAMESNLSQSVDVGTDGCVIEAPRSVLPASFHKLEWSVSCSVRQILSDYHLW